MKIEISNDKLESVEKTRETLKEAFVFAKKSGLESIDTYCEMLKKAYNDYIDKESEKLLNDNEYIKATQDEIKENGNKLDLDYFVYARSGNFFEIIGNMMTKINQLKG